MQQKVDGLDYNFSHSIKNLISEDAHGDGVIILDNGSTTSIFKGNHG